MIVRCPTNTSSKIQRIMIRDEAGRPLTGLGASSPGAQAAFVVDGMSAPTPIALVQGTGPFVSGGFREIDAAAMPGLYEIGVPDDIFTSGSRSAVLMLRFEGAQPTVVHFDLVAYDPYDPVRLGLSCLSQEARHACLSSAFQTIVPDIVDELVRSAER